MIVIFFMLVVNEFNFRNFDVLNFLVEIFLIIECLYFFVLNVIVMVGEVRMDDVLIIIVVNIE